MDERLERTVAALGEAAAEWAVLTTPDAVAYATGHVVPIEAGPSPFAGGPTTALVGRDGSTALVAANVEGAAAAASRAQVTELYEGFTYEHGPDLATNYAGALRRARDALGLSGVVAVEPASLPARAVEALALSVDRSITGPLDRARAIKTAEEIAALERAAEIASTGQRAFAASAAPGRTELDAFAAIRLAMEGAAGERLPVTGDFMSGRERTAGFTAWPNARTMQPGDPVICDLAPRVGGYWGDSCASSVLGEPDDAYLRLFEAARSALDLALSIMRPGLAVAELDRRLRAHVAGRTGRDYPHHSGHSLGTAVHEWPRLVPYEEAALEAGMVLMVEPGAYDSGIGGVRTEHMVEVTANGCRALTDFEHHPFIAP